jgi:hypothetical protein
MFPYALITITVASFPLAFSVANLQRRQQVESAHLRHAHVGEHHVRAEGIDERQSLLPGRCGLDLVAVTPEQRAEHEPEILLVVDHQNAAHCEKNANSRRPVSQSFQGFSSIPGV